MQTFHVEKTDSQYIVSWGYFTYGIIFGFLVLIGLAFSCLWLLHLAFVQQIFAVGLLAITLCGVWFLMLVGVLNTLFGSIKIILDEEGLETRYSCLWINRKKRIDLAEIRRFEAHALRHNRGQVHRLRIVRQKNHDELSLPPKYVKKELEGLCNQLNVLLGVFKAERDGVPVEWELPEPILFELHTPPLQLEQPSKSRWKYQTDFNGITCKKRGGGYKIWDTIILFSRVFCVTGMIVLVLLLGGDLWKMLAMLTPVILLGLGCIVKLFFHVAEWCRITHWTFACNEAECRTGCLGWTRTRHYDITDWNFLLVCLPADERVKPELIAEGNPDAIREYYDESELWQIAFLNSAEEQMFAVKNLTKSEALWMADVLLREQRVIR